MNRTTYIACHAAKQMALMLAASITLIAVAETLNWYVIWRQIKGEGQ